MNKCRTARGGGPGQVSTGRDSTRMKAAAEDMQFELRLLARSTRYTCSTRSSDQLVVEMVKIAVRFGFDASNAEGRYCFLMTCRRCCLRLSPLASGWPLRSIYQVDRHLYRGREVLLSLDVSTLLFETVSTGERVAAAQHLSS